MRQAGGALAGEDHGDERGDPPDEAAGAERAGEEHHIIQPRAAQLDDVMQERTVQS